MKKIRCRLGFHNFKTFVTAGESYLRCPDCGKYGGTPTRLIGGWVSNEIRRRNEEIRDRVAASLGRSAAEREPRDA